MLDRGEKVALFDVRTPDERKKAVIAEARHLDDAGEAYFRSLDKGATIVFHCHHGGRSRQAAERAVQEGYKSVYNLEGGIDAWSASVDPSVPRY
jgi:monothiol glutaredoxin